MREMAVKQNRKPRACPSKAEQCLFVHPCACTPFCISSEAAFPTDWRRQGFFSMLGMITVTQSCWLINSAGPTASSSRVWRIATSQGYELGFHAFVPLFLPSADFHSLSLSILPSIFLSAGQFEAGKPIESYDLPVPVAHFLHSLCFR